MQMGFRVSQKTLERLEWEQILARLAEFARTPRGRARFARRGEEGAIPIDLFEPDLAGVRERLAETGEARATLSGGDHPPLGGVPLGTHIPAQRLDLAPFGPNPYVVNHLVIRTHPRQHLRPNRDIFRQPQALPAALV